MSKLTENLRLAPDNYSQEILHLKEIQTHLSKYFFESMCKTPCCAFFVISPNPELGDRNIKFCLRDGYRIIEYLKWVKIPANHIRQNIRSGS